MGKTVSLNVRTHAESNKSVKIRLPFMTEQPRYNAETEAAMREVDEMLASGNFKAYNSYAELEADILAEMEAETAAEMGAADID